MNLFHLIQKGFCLFILFQSMCIFAQQNPSAQPNSSSTANASTADFQKWQAFHNPAILAKSKNVRANVLYQNRFQLKELSTSAISLGIPTKLVNIGLASSHFGYEQYNEMQGGIALAKSFTPKFSLGFQANYYSIYLSPEEGYRRTLVTQIGLLTESLQNFYVGFHAYNPSQTNITVGLTEKRIPSVFSFGAAYRFGENLLWLAQLDKEIDYDLLWRTGFEYLPVEELAIRLGGYGNPFVPCLGASLLLKKFNVDLNFERHPTLGINSACGLTYKF
jgi:hypothetical protein